MVTLAEIESAAAGLSPAEKQERMLFLASRLRPEGAPLYLQITDADIEKANGADDSRQVG